MTNIEEQLNNQDVQNKLKEKEKGLYEETKEEIKKPNIVMGHTLINKSALPSQGLFYDDSLEINVKSAHVKEIRFFTNLNEDSSIDTKEKINYIIDKCCKFSSKAKHFTYLDLLEIDKMYLLFAIRDLTFNTIPNSLINSSHCDSCGKPISIDVMSSNTSFYEPNKDIYKYYNAQKKCFEFTLDNGEEVSLKLPTIGASEKVYEYIKNRQNIGAFDMNEISDTQFLLYLNIDWKFYSIENIHKILTESLGWSIEKYSLIVKFIETVESSIVFRSHTICNSCSAEVTIPFSFQGRLRHIFIIQNIFNRLR